MDALSNAITDSTGRFTVSQLPAGSQVAEVRKLGYTLGRTQVELRRGRTAEMELRLTRFVSLDSVRVLARRTRYREFEDHRRNWGWGTFLDEEQVANRHVFYTSDIVRTAPGMRVFGEGVTARLVSSRGVFSLTGAPCEINVVIDGLEQQDINMIRPRDIGAMEIYSSAVGVPLRVLGQFPVRRGGDLDQASDRAAGDAAMRRAMIGIALLASGVAGAQQAPPRGRIDGEIVDSVHARPLGGATVMAIRLAPEPAEFFGTTADARGRFHFDTLAPGRYSVAFTTAFFDSLDVMLPPRELVVVDGATARVDMVTPSGATLRDAACRGLSLRPGEGAVVGEVTDADSNRPIVGARVVVGWNEITLDRKTLKRPARRDRVHHHGFARTVPALRSAHQHAPRPRTSDRPGYGRGDRALVDDRPVSRDGRSR